MRRSTAAHSLLVILLTSACLSCGHAPSPVDPNSLIGIWAVQTSFGPAVRGDVTIDVERLPWQATIATFRAPMSYADHMQVASLPGGAGELRAWEMFDSAGHGSIHALWMQPRGTVHFSGYVSPVEMHQSGPSTWTGHLAPLDDRITFYVLVRRVNGTVTAFVRNPEFNWLGRNSYQVEVAGDRVTLRAANGSLSGRYDRQHDTLALPLLDLSPPVPPLQLSRVTEKEATGLFARAGERGNDYTYRQPVARGDGWDTTTLFAAGIEQSRMAALMRRIISTDPADLHAPAIHSILIARHGKLALEEYFCGADADQSHDMRSAGKTWAPMLVDVVLRRVLLPPPKVAGAVRPGRDRSLPWPYDLRAQGASSKVLRWFVAPERRANIDVRKERMTLRDLMTMTSGLDCDDNDEASLGNENRMQSQQGQPDWYKYTLDLPMVRDPGGDHAVYCSAGINLVGGIARMATRSDMGEMPLSTLFEAFIARPLQFGTYHLNLMPTGEVYFGGGAYIRPRDQLKLGQVYLNGGAWHGQDVVSKEWVAESIAHHSTFKPVNDLDADHGYGYAWHLHHFTVNGHDYREYAAEGNGGQMVMVVPDLDLVVVVCAGNYGDRGWYRWALRLLPDWIVPAVRP